jgi:hypothetical protein
MTDSVTIRPTKFVVAARILTAVAVIAVTVVVAIVVRTVGSSRDGWRIVAESEADANADLRAQLTTQSAELACRSEAAANESGALGDLTIHIGETAEAALRLAAGEQLTHDAIEQLVTSLHDSSTAVRAATEARQAAIDGCDITPATSPGG